MRNPILILCDDIALGSLIARSLRLQQVYARQMPLHKPVQEILALQPAGIILAAPQEGEAEVPSFPLPSLLTAGIPLFALGSFAAALCLHFGGGVPQCRSGSQTVTLGMAAHPLLAGMAGGERVLHGFHCLSLPESLALLATATEQPIGFFHGELPLYALQYPIEHNDPDSAQLLYNFATHLCGAQADWDEHAIIHQAVEGIRKAAGEGRVLCALSGGVDSMVSAKLARLAVGDQLRCIVVDTGLLRAGEAQEVKTACQETLGLEALGIDAQEAFLRAMAGISGAQDKERITMTLLRQVFRKQLADDPSIKVLVLGTNFHDVLRGSIPADAGPEGLLGDADCELVEPLQDLYKEEVRRLAEALSLPPGVVNRQSFPASGLALRILGEVTQERLAWLRAADALFLQELYEGGHEKRLWQYYATLLEAPAEPGTYVVALRALQAAQERAYAARLPYDVLERTTQKILQELPKVRRVIYDLTPSLHGSEQE